MRRKRRYRTAVVPALLLLLAAAMERPRTQIFFLAALGAFLLDWRLLRRGRWSSGWQQVLGLLVLWGLAFLFVYFTFHPPGLGLWQDPVTGGYGIP